MPKLYFRVESDWEKVVQLREEISKLETQMKSMDANKAPAAVATLNRQINEAQSQLKGMVSEASKAAVVMDGDFKSKIYQGSQAVNDFTQKIISQKSVVKDVEADVRRLTDAYRSVRMNPLKAGNALGELNAAKRALNEEKSALFDLTQQQANARLSVKKLQDEYALYNNNGKQVVETNNDIAISWKKALGVIGGVAVLKQLGSEIIRVRGEFQSMQTAIETLVGKGMSDKLLPQIKELAKISPLTMSDMIGAEKMMLGFNIQAEDTIKYLKAISDISMGESSKFNSLTLAFSQMSAAGKLMGQDLNQMINAGFNPLQIISEKTGKSIATLKDEMSKGAISAEMVQQAFIDATSAGGKFYNMSENASKTINGQISMMQDALDNAFNEIGQASEEFIMSGIQATTSLIQNYETIGKVLVGMIATYGVYKTALITNIALTRGWAVAARADATAKGIQTIATKAQTVAQLALNSAMKANPYVLAATLIVGAATAMWAFHDSTTESEKAQGRFNKKQKEAAKQEQEHKEKIDSLVESSRDIALADLQRGQSLAELRKEYPKIFSQYDIETIKLADILKLKRQIADEDAKRAGEKKEKELSDLESEIKYYENLLKTLSGQQGVDGYVKKLKELRADRDVLLQENGKVISEQFISNLKNIDINEFDHYIFELEKRIKGKGENGKVKLRLPIDAKGSLSEEAIYDLKDIKTLIDTAKTAKKTKEEAAKAEKKSAAEWLLSYKKAYDDAEKAYKDFLSSKKIMSDADRDKELKRLKDLRDTAKATYERKGGSTSSDSKKDDKAQKLREEQEKYNALLDKQSLEQQRSAEDLQMRVDEARIKAMDEGSAKTIAEMELNFEKEMQAIDRQKEDAFRKKVEDARAAWEANPKNKGKSFNATDIKLSDDEQNYYDELYKTAIISNEKIYKDLAERYLSYADERLAIEKKFNDDISILQEARKKAETKGDASEIAQIDRSIEKRTEIKNEDIFKLDAEQFKKNMNWEQVFGNLDKVSTDTLKKLKANLKDFISSQKDLSPESLKELVDAIERIDDKVSERDPFETMSISFKSLKEVTDAQREAQKAYNKALEEGTDEEKKNAKATLESAKNSKQKALYEATDALHKGINEIGQYVDAGNQVIGIMETLGIKTPEWMEGTMSGFGEMLNGLGNIDLMKPMSIITGSLQTVKGALTSVISLGGLIPGLDGADYSHYNEMVEEYNKLNEIWDELIDKKLEYINTSYGAEADKVGKEALELVNKSIEAYRILGRERLNSGASAGSHSIGKRMAKNTSSSDWQDIARALDMSVKDAKDFIGTGRMTGLFDLTTEQLEKLKSEAPTFWAKLDGDVRDYLDKIIEGEERIEEIHNQINEQLTQTTFDGVYSNFIDTLMDMKASSKDAAEDVSEYFMQAMLSEQIGTLYQDKLKKWYEKFAKGMEDGSLTESERNALNNEYMGYIEEAMKLRDELAAATGYDKISQESTSQSSASRGFGTEMTHEDAGELSGRFTALQIAGEEIKNQNIIQSQSLNLLTVKADALLSINTETRNIADDTRDLIAQSYLELVQISENTGAIVKPIIQIQKDMAEVKNNTSKL